MTKTCKLTLNLLSVSQKNENVHIIILISIRLFQILDFFSAVFYFYRKMGNRVDLLPVLLLTLVNCFIFTSK